MAKKNKDQFDDIFGKEPSNSERSEDFAILLENSQKSVGRRLGKGDDFRGEILGIGKEEAFVSTGTPVDAVILVRDLMGDEKELKYKVGDFIDCVVVQIRQGEIRAAKKGSKAASSDLDSLEDAFDMELPVEGRVTETCNGGFRVLIQGKTAFCPISQIDFKVSADHNEYVGQKMDFMVTQFEKQGRNIVVSRRRILEQQRAENEGTFMLKNQPGAILQGRITKIEKFGAFVVLDSGVEGLIHISELAWSRISDPHEVVQLNMPVQVKLLKVEDLNGKLKISLSLKEGGGEGDPWLTLSSKHPVGTVLKGKVEKKENYGLFVNILPGVTGLLPRSKWRDSVDAASYENKKKGDEFQVQIDEINLVDRRISLGLPKEGDDPSWRSHSSSSQGGSGFGTFGDLLSKIKK